MLTKLAPPLIKPHFHIRASSDELIRKPPLLLCRICEIKIPADKMLVFYSL